MPVPSGTNKAREILTIQQSNSLIPWFLHYNNNIKFSGLCFDEQHTADKSAVGENISCHGWKGSWRRCSISAQSVAVKVKFSDTWWTGKDICFKVFSIMHFFYSKNDFSLSKTHNLNGLQRWLNCCMNDNLERYKIQQLCKLESFITFITPPPVNWGKINGGESLTENCSWKSGWPFKK